MKAKALIPLALFLLLVVFLAIGLTRDPREIPSPLIDKAAPDFKLAQLHAPDKQLTLADMQGQVWLLNVWGLVVCCLPGRASGAGEFGTAENRAHHWPQLQGQDPRRARLVA